VPLGEEIPLERGRHIGVPLRNRYFTAIKSSSVRTVADRHRLLLITTSTGDELSGCTNIDDLQRVRTQKITGFGKFFAISGYDRHFESELRDAPNSLKYNVHMKFSALNVDYNFRPARFKESSVRRYQIWAPLQKARFLL